MIIIENNRMGIKIICPKCEIIEKGLKIICPSVKGTTHAAENVLSAL